MIQRPLPTLLCDIFPMCLAKLTVTKLHASFQRFLKRDAGATVYFIGNGGSASTASHFANDLTIGTNSYEKPFRIISLADNQAVISAIEMILDMRTFFSVKRILGKPGDVLIAISASGNSPNLISAFEYAHTVGIKTVALTAFDGGRLRNMADEAVHVPTEAKEYGPAEDVHLILNHLVGNYLTRLVKSRQGPRNGF